tara:strand:+ start:671 stop:1492 length:822 start_codon:yes stop_codon:yes gene_type:complete
MSTVIFTSSSLRHKAFAAIIKNNSNIDLVKVFHEEGSSLNELIEKRQNNNVELGHLEARALAEKDFFELYINMQKEIKSISKIVPKFWFSSKDCLQIIKEINPSQILVYGTSIIKGDIINKFKRRIFNLHLGLSPYYRGAGTNYFPFVNNEPEYAGSTFMYLDEGIDTGEIIHQIRPIINITDSFHQFSNRFLIHSFQTYSKIAERNLQNGLKEPFVTSTMKNNKRLLYKTADFSKESVLKMYENFKNGMIDQYLLNQKDRCNNVPILEQDCL